MSTSKYTRPVIFSKLEDGTEFMLLLHTTVFIKVSPQNVIESDESSRKVNAMSKSKVFKTWVLDAEMAYIKEQ